MSSDWIEWCDSFEDTWGGGGYAVSLKYPGRRASEQYGLVQSTSLYNPHLKVSCDTC